ncbi:RAMP superfamily CRISPR-associated protein [Streptobacillus canis]|uniref:RAMP superfamily CRISPR-associated protein n=1 Tax=Streptobacillus canis TaxID=2678686 RepID=UPI0012E31E15|nr:RAMP superfamily CRISPR-associated protein [Streptobacillus canis]
MNKYLDTFNKVTIYVEINTLEPCKFLNAVDKSNDNSNIDGKDKGKGKGISNTSTVNYEINNERIFYIPGSTIRGKIREIFSLIQEIKNDKNNLENDLFGIVEGENSVKSRIFVEDAKFQENQIELINQSIPKNKTAESRIIINNCKYFELFDILKIIQLSHYDQFKIGSNKYKGKGLVEIIIKEIKIEFSSLYNEISNEYINYKIEKNFEETFYNIIDKSSIKLGDKYLKLVYEVKKEIIENIFSTDFVKHIEEYRGNKND